MSGKIKAKIETAIKREANNIREYCTDSATGDLNITQAEEWIQTATGLYSRVVRDIIDQCVFEWADREGLI